MRQFKRIWSLITAYMLIFSMVVSVHASGDTGASTIPKYANAAQILMDLNLMPEGYGDPFSLEDTLTRADAAEVIVKLLGYTATGESVDGTVFSDVEAYHKSAAVIKMATDLKLLTGYSDGTFHPDEAVTYQQAVKMIICALNYQVQAMQRGGYPTGFLAVAADIGLTKGIEANGEDTITKGNMAQMAYNALDVDILEQTGFDADASFSKTRGNNILTIKHSIYKETGRVTGTYFTKLNAESDLKKDQIEIAGEVFNVSSKITNADKLLGYQVSYYYTEDDATNNMAILSIQPDKDQNKVIEVNAENIQDYEDNVFTYWLDKDKDRDAKKARISKYKDVIYNGNVDLHYNDGDFRPYTGKVVLLDSNHDDLYDVVFITNYTNYVVKGKDIDDYCIYDEYGQGELSLDPNAIGKKITILNDGAEAKFEDIMIWNVVSAAISKDGNIITANICSNMLEGIVSEIDSDSVVIGSEKIKIASSFQNTGIPISVNDKGKFYLDIDGKIAGMDLDKISGKFYGYLINAAPKRGLNGPLQMKILGQDGKVITYECEKDVTLNGIQYDPNDIITVLKHPKDPAIPLTAFNNFQQVIIYNVNGDGKLDKLLNWEDGTAGGLKRDYKEVNEAATSDPNTTFVYRQYKSWALAFNQTIGIGSQTIIFNVPRKKDVDAGLSQDKDFEVRKADLFSNDTNYIVEGYNSDEVGLVDVLVRYYDLTSTEMKDTDGVAMVDNITTVLNDGETVSKIYVLADGTNKTFITSKDMKFLDNGTPVTLTRPLSSILKRGCVIQYKNNDKGMTLVLRVLIDPTGNITPIDTGANRTQTVSTVLGQVYGKNTDYISVSSELGPNNKYVFNKGKMWYCSPTKGNIYFYDQKKDKVYATKSLMDVKDYATVGNKASIAYVRFASADIRNTFIFNK